MDADEIREPEAVEESVEAGDENREVVGDDQLARMGLEKQFERGANWFYWIAGLSIVNSAVALSGVMWSFVVGLGITQIVDAIVIGEDASLKARIVAFGFDLIIASWIALFGYLARKRLRWAFIVGMVFYALDGVLFLLAQDFFGLAFHGFAMFGIYGGFKACGQLKVLEGGRSSVVPAGPMAGMLEAEGRAMNLLPKVVVWPGVIAIMSFMYVVFYSVVSIADWPNYAMLTGSVLLFGGIAGVVLKRRAAVNLFFGGAGVIIFYTLFKFISSFVEGVRDGGAEGLVLGLILASFVILVALLWPLFLVFWFLRRTVREYVEAAWV